MTNNKALIPNGSVAEVAEYKKQIIPEYQNNPLIEALPLIKSTTEVINGLHNYPDFDPIERNMDNSIRLHILNRVYEIYQPLPKIIDLENRISRTIRLGYTSRNPLSLNFVKSFNGSSINTTAYGFAVIGISGIGKTSGLNRILNMYPQTIIHREYQSQPLSLYQLVWIRIECPFDGSIKGFMCEFFSNVDRLMGTNYYRKASTATTDNMIIIMTQVIRNTCLGLLVVDEIQHLNFAKSGGSQKLLNFFVTLVNTIGIPIILVGTPIAMGILQNEFRQARREIGIGGSIILDRLIKGREWDLLINCMWKYQWTKHHAPLTQDINNLFYNETQGITDLLIKLFVMAQAYAINSKKEIIDESIIKKVAIEGFRIIQPMLKALKSGNTRELAKYQDVYIPEMNLSDIFIETRNRIVINSIASEKKDQKILYNKLEIDLNAIKPEKGKSVRKKEDIPSEADDIRVIISEGAKNNKTAYESLKEHGYINASIEV